MTVYHLNQSDGLSINDDASHVTFRGFIHSWLLINEREREREREREERERERERETDR